MDTIEIENLKKRIVKLEKRLDKLAPEPPVNDCYLFEHWRGNFLVFLASDYNVTEITDLNRLYSSCKVWSIIYKDRLIMKDQTKLIEHWLPRARNWDFQTMVSFKDQDQDYKIAEAKIAELISRFF